MAPVRNPNVQRLVNEATERAQEKVTQMFKGSKLFSKDRQYSIPSFHLPELTLGNILGRGEFCVVQSISSIDLFEHDASSTTKFDIFPSDFLRGDDMETKKRMQTNCSQNTAKSEKYVVKCLTEDVQSSPSQFQRGIIDLIIETQILSVVSHPNIIQLRGFNKQALFTPHYFIVLDQLQCTLHDKMEEWIRKLANRNVLRKMMDKRKSHKSMKEKLGYAAELASALAYLHTLR